MNLRDSVKLVTFHSILVVTTLWAQTPMYSTYENLSSADNVANCVSTSCWSITSANLTQISAGGHRGSLYGLDSTGAVWKEDFSTSPPTWMKSNLPAVNSIAAGNGLTVWAIGKDASGPNAYQLSLSQNVWVKKGSSRLTSISAGGDGDVWATSTTQVDSHGYAVLHWDRTLQGWTQMTGSLKQVAAGSKTITWGVDLLQNIWKYDTTTSTWMQMYGQATQITAAMDGTVWKLNSSGVAARFNSAGNGGNCTAAAGAPAAACWVSIAGTMQQISAGSSKYVWGIGSYSGSYNTYYLHTRTSLLTAGIQGYTRCFCPPGMNHTYNVSAHFNGLSPVTNTYTAPVQASVNVYVAQHPSCDPYSDMADIYPCYWEAVEEANCPVMSNFINNGVNGWLVWPWIDSMVPLSATAGDTHVSVSIYGSGFAFNASVAVIDDQENRVPITVSNVLIVNPSHIDAVLSVPANFTPGDYGVIVIDGSLPDGQGSGSNVEPFTIYAETAACATPVNFRRSSWFAQLDGALNITYVWDSSTGRQSDLSACVIAEIVSYPGTTNPYVWPRPPFGSSTPNPDSHSGNGSSGGFIDHHYPPTSWIKPYIPASFVAKQTYQFVCPCANGGNQVPLGDYTISRSVQQNTDGTYRYVVTKSSGETATVNPLP